MQRQSVRKIPNRDRAYDLMDSLPFELDIDGPWLSGGSARRLLLGQEITTDVDIFFRTSEQLEQCKKSLQKEIEDENGVILEKYSSANQTTYHISSVNNRDWYKVQLITKDTYPDYKALINSFDFNICQVVFDGRDFFYPVGAFQDIKEGNLKVHRITYPVSSFRRVQKYLEQGFSISNEEVIKLIGELYSSLDNDEEYYSEPDNIWG